MDPTDGSYRDGVPFVAATPVSYAEDLLPPTPRYMAPMPDKERTLTAPYGRPTEAEIEARIKAGIEAGIDKIEKRRRMDLVFDTLRLMDDAERARVMRELVNVFGIGAGL